MSLKGERVLALALLVAGLGAAGCGSASAPSPPGPNPQPSISSLSPPSAVMGGPGFTLTITGANFVSSSVVNWKGASRATTFVSSTQLTAAILASDIATAGTAQVTVFNSPAGGGTSASVNFVVVPTQTGQMGQWSEPFTFNPPGMVAVHMALMRTGQVLALDGPPQDGGGSAVLWTPPPIGQPGTGTFTPVPNNFSNMFCSGHVFLGDGRLLVVGGHIDNFVGIRDANLFDPTQPPAQTWSPVAQMSFGRWYPSATTLPDGRVLVVSGSQSAMGDNVRVPEVYDSSTNTWTQLNSVSASLFLPLYPYLFVLPDGRLLQAGSDEAQTATRVLDVNTQTWTTIDAAELDGGSAAMYLPGKVIKTGSPGDVDLPSVASVATTYVLDVPPNATSAQWHLAAPMAFPRAHHNLTLLPDGNVLVTGGGRNTGGTDVSTAVFEAELWSPQTEQWTTMAAMQTPRLYHSTALLLPDGRVAVAGGGRFASAPDEMMAEIYSPGYLFRGARPTITSAPSAISYANSFTLTTPDTSGIVAVTLVRPGAVTHAYNQDQRFLNLSFTRAGSTLTVTAPTNANLVPPGHYMLFVINTSGVPSIASFIRLQR